MKTTSLILVAALLAAPLQSEQPKQPKGAAAGAAVVVIVVGGFILWKIVRFCKKKFPPPNTNATPGNLAMNTQYGASFSVAQQCTPDDDGEAVTFYVTLAPSGMLTQEAIAYAQDFPHLKSQVASNGLSMVPIIGASSFSKDGQPIPAAQSPIQYDSASKVVTVGAGGQMVRIERSKDLKEWESMGTVNMPVGNTLQIEDASQQGQMFYRVVR